MIPLLVLALLTVGPAADAQDDRIDDELLVEMIERSSFSDLATRLGSGATPLGVDPAQLARALFAPSIRLPDREREALLLLMLRAATVPASAPGAAADPAVELTTVLFARLDRLEDWSLLALLFEEGERVGTGTLAHGLEVAERILAALDDASSSRAGYEPAAIAVARHARAAAAATVRPESEGESGGGVGAAFALAETLRSIARMSRSEAVVDAARASARILLGLPAPETDR